MSRKYIENFTRKPENTVQKCSQRDASQNQTCVIRTEYWNWKEGHCMGYRTKPWTWFFNSKYAWTLYLGDALMIFAAIVDLEPSVSCQDTDDTKTVCEVSKQEQ